MHTTGGRQPCGYDSTANAFKFRVKFSLSLNVEGSLVQVEPSTELKTACMP